MALKSSDADRVSNAIEPGLWEPGDPIIFGGTSVEAALREALHDPARRARARESLGLATDQEELDEVTEPMSPHTKKLRHNRRASDCTVC